MLVRCIRVSSRNKPALDTGVNSLFPSIGTQAGRGSEAGDKLFSFGYDGL